MLNLRCKEAWRDVADLHSTLCRAFSEPESKCAPGAFLWRLEPETRNDGSQIVLIQSENIPDWSRIGIMNWLAERPEKLIDVKSELRLQPDSIVKGSRYRLRTNPSVKRNGKRVGLYKAEEQNAWFVLR